MPFADDHFYTQYDAMVGSLVSKYAQKEPLFVHRAASVKLGSDPTLAARPTKVGFGPFASSDTGERIADFLLCISIA